MNTARVLTESSLDAKSEKVLTLEAALRTHIEARSLLVQTVRQCIEKLATDVMAKKGEGVEMETFHWKGGTFLGGKEEIDGNPTPNGYGINFHKTKNGEVTIANWSSGKKNGSGIKLLKNKVAFCGKWTNDEYDGNAVYFWHDESVQEGVMKKDHFNGKSQSVSVSGAVSYGEWINDAFNQVV